MNMSLLAFTGSFEKPPAKNHKTALFVDITKSKRSHIPKYKSYKLDVHDADYLLELITTLQSLPTYLKTAFTPEIILSIVRV